MKATKKKVAEKTQTDIVLELMDKYPKITPKEIEQETGIKRATIYAIQSRARNKSKKAHDTVEHHEHMKQVSTVSTKKEKATQVSKVELFDHVTKHYLNKIETAENMETAEKYNELLIKMMQAL